MVGRANASYLLIKTKGDSKMTSIIVKIDGMIKKTDQIFFKI
jgi:hypothetical protein